MDDIDRLILCDDLLSSTLIAPSSTTFALPTTTSDNDDDDVNVAKQRSPQSSLRSSSSGYSTPLMTPIALDLPSMTPGLLEPASNTTRQRSLSDVAPTCAFDMAGVSGGGIDFQHVWESLDVASTAMALLEDSENQLESHSSRNVHKKTKKKTQAAMDTARQLPATKKKRTLDGDQSTSSSKQNRKHKIVPPAIRAATEEGAQALPQPYSKQERILKVARFAEKRKRRVWKKEIKYSCRQQFAESRPRVAGRFIPKRALQASSIQPIENPPENGVSESGSDNNNANKHQQQTLTPISPMSSSSVESSSRPYHV